MKSRLPVVFIFITLVLDAMGIGLIIPVMPDLLDELSDGGISDAAFWGGWLAFTYAVMQFLFGPTLGNLSDRYGRRPVLLISMVVMGLDYLLMAVAPTLWLLFVARIINGITGATQATANAYMADISKPEDRAANFGLLGAGFGIGFILGPAIGGLLGEIGPRAPFYAAAGLALANAVLGAIVLKETLPPERRRPFRLREGNPAAAILRLRAVPQIGGLIAVVFAYQLASNVYPVIWAFFTTAKLGWSPGLIGQSLAAFGVCVAVVQGGLIRVFIDRFGPERTVQIGLMLNLVALVSIAFVPYTMLLFMLLPICALGIIVTPAAQGIMSAALSADRQGELQGVWASSDGAARIVSPPLMTGLFALFTAPGLPYLPGAPFLAAALLTVVSLVLFLRWRAGMAAPAE
ncbi:MAG: TCR/Tet family MFS transporter [Pseudomonadota bacterium]